MISTFRYGETVAAKTAHFWLFYGETVAALR